MAMVSPYIEYFSNNKINFDIIRANRYNINAEKIKIIKKSHGDIYELKMVFRPGTSKFRKVFSFIRFRIHAERIIKSKIYDYIVVWNENTVAIFSDLLIKEFPGRYCLNIRDWYPKLIERRVINAGNNSHFITAVSPESREFSRYNKGKVLCLYNQDMELRRRWKIRLSFRDKNMPIRITHMGFYSKARVSDRMLELFGNDERFILQFYGDGFDKEFMNLVNKMGVRNVKTGGSFEYERTLDYLSETDIINSYYNYTSDPEYHASFGIKHSYTPLLCIPGLADEDTCWGRMSKQYGLAYLVNERNLKTLPDDLYHWYRNLDFDTFNKGCNELFSVMEQSKLEIYEKLDDVLKK